MKRSLRWLVAVVAVGALVGAGCGDDDDGGTAGGADCEAADGSSISIGAQDFGESAILAEIYKQGLEACGYDVGIQELGGFRPLELPAFESGDINFAPEYVASMLEFLNEDESEATADVGDSTDLLQGYLDDLELQALEPSEAVDTNSFVVTSETADDLGLATLSDLADKGEDLTLGGPSDCPTNPFCLPGLEDVYGLDLSDNFQSLEAGAIADALDAGAIDIGIIFSTDGRIAERDWVLLEDDQTMLAADNVVPVVTAELADSLGAEFADRVNAISAALTTEGLTELNKRFDVDKDDAADIARDWLAEHDFV
ncbi:MAG: ABC transporter substrate-binding protein [Acidimicrobiales bacterium]